MELPTEASFSIGPIIIGFIIIGFLVGIALYFYTKTHHNEYDQGGGHIMLIITNESKIPYIITFANNKTIELLPDQQSKVSVGHHDILTAKGYNYDGTPVEHIYKISNPNANKLYITSAGFRSNISGADNVQFVNNSPYPIMFIEKSSKGGRRWASDIVPPHNTTKSHFVGKRTTWEVAHPTAENQPIAELTVHGKATKLVFDGSSLKSY
uniref:Uncharacterized protein n=1 Tax=Marseillevirus LCMAC102 TaxID=2506603 RepID=A0A481YTL8_9VIRU|nr:MAG: hypothetical protein LCMAC102_04600 [Marseillevirus LCMAC102]